MFITEGVIGEVEKSNAALAHLAKPYSFCFVRERDGGFSAYVREFPGCYSQGESLQQAYYNLSDAAMDWIMAAKEAGQDIPEPLDRAH